MLLNAFFASRGVNQKLINPANQQQKCEKRMRNIYFAYFNPFFTVLHADLFSNSLSRFFIKLV